MDLPPKNKCTLTLAWLTQHVVWSRNTINARMGEDLLLILSFGVLHTVQLSQDIISERDSAAL